MIQGLVSSRDILIEAFHGFHGFSAFGSFHFDERTHYPSRTGFGSTRTNKHSESEAQTLNHRQPMATVNDEICLAGSQVDRSLRPAGFFQMSC